MASTERRAVGIFSSRIQTASALQALSDSGFSMGDVSVIARDADHQADIAGVSVKGEVSNQAGQGSTVGAATGGLLGGVTGLLVGLGTLTIPGLGPALLAGEAAIVITTLIGGAAGAAAGGLLGALIGLGIPKHRATRYRDRVAQGDYLVMVRGSEAAIARAQKTLGGAGIEDWGVYQTTAAPGQVELQSGALSDDRRHLNHADLGDRDRRPVGNPRPPVDPRPRAHDRPLQNRPLQNRPLPVDERSDLSPVPPLGDPNPRPLVDDRQGAVRQSTERSDLKPVPPLEESHPTPRPLVDERQGGVRQGMDRQTVSPPIVNPQTGNPQTVYPVPPLDDRDLNRRDLPAQEPEQRRFERHDITYRDDLRARPPQQQSSVVARDLHPHDGHAAPEGLYASDPLPTVGSAAAAEPEAGDRYGGAPETPQTQERRTEERRVVGIFLDQSQMEEALAQLQKTGFAMHTLSIAVREANSPDTQPTQPYGGHSLAGATRLTAGLDRVILPEIGTLLVMGPDADALSKTVAYQSGRAAAADQGLGIAPESAHLYRRHISDGAYLVTLRGRNQDVLQAATTLGEWGMRDWGIYDVWQH
ncbi:hypothetical protein PGN35_003415 [Nodosilinea sp. PGN35]|uniref:hypothetical protein n=1 Tax=Nodosilinea sp. PGN35 TaxID=3020489 RepID=UPI0023B260FF|nr:hypothetical protein [Nodosilinea sp. TSF1-S3]MDF0365669.1 hypothetical protein [Nodosilinea sp. TSF1-S3]